MITGLNHITLAVAQLDRSFGFYVDTLGAQPLARWSRGSYLLLGDIWLCLDVDTKTRIGPLPEYTHIAFNVDADSFNSMAIRIRNAGATIWKENRSEGPSLYFLDPDGHKLEIHVGDWRSRIAAMKAAPWEAGIKFFD